MSKVARDGSNSHSHQLALFADLRFVHQWIYCCHKQRGPAHDSMFDQKPLYFKCSHTSCHLIFKQTAGMATRIIEK